MPIVRGFARKSTNLTIANGATTSEALDIRDWSSGNYFIPSAFTGTVITFSVSDDGGTFTTLRDIAGGAAADLDQTVSTSRWYPFPKEVFSFGYVKLISGSSEGAARTINIGLSAKG